MSASAEQPFVVRAAALALWAFGVWLLVTWTVTAEQLAFGAGLALVVGLSLAPLGDVVPPWRLLDPRRTGSVLVLIVTSLSRVVRANVVLAGRIWAPLRPLRSGMIIVPTSMRSDVNLGAAGLITSLIVDNQIVDLDTERHELQFHAVAVPPGDKPQQSESINAPTERLIARIARRP